MGVVLSIASRVSPVQSKHSLCLPTHHDLVHDLVLQEVFPWADSVPMGRQTAGERLWPPREVLTTCEESPVHALLCMPGTVGAEGCEGNCGLWDLDQLLWIDTRSLEGWAGGSQWTKHADKRGYAYRAPEV